ncbi:MAG: hypothetical protein DA408_13540 [Bacteroidetes bacterium]|nr:MAG: hypothetical protein C7N36_14005 [Bacteroidota bacterium]PTM11430.1 MAG: hypothetical protein DA408_13540 [Bacteroidota bacterium]
MYNPTYLHRQLRTILLVGLCFLLRVGAAQHFYVQSRGGQVGGWIVSPAGEAVFEIPQGWRLISHGSPLAPITSWPLLLTQRNSPSATNFAWLHEDLRWEPVDKIAPGTAYRTAWADSETSASWELVQDEATGFLGYQNSHGEWTIAPRFCQATAFQFGVALTASNAPDNCSSSLRSRGRNFNQPPTLVSNRVIRAYQLIDTTGQEIWADSCESVYLLAPGIIGVNAGFAAAAPGIYIEWLAEKRVWWSPDFTITFWQQLAKIPAAEVRRLNLGIWRYELFHQKIHGLPADFSQRLPTFTYLEYLNLSYYQVDHALATIFEQGQLRTLVLKGCGLTTIPGSIRNLRQLEELDLSGNQLTELPGALYRMTHLRVLNIAENPLPPATIPRLRKALPDTEIIYK